MKNQLLVLGIFVWGIGAQATVLTSNESVTDVQSSVTDDIRYYMLQAPTKQVRVLSEVENNQALEAIGQYYTSYTLAFDDDLKPFNQAGAEEGGGGLDIVQLVLKVWDIVQQGKPTLNAQSKFASALPEVAKDHWEKLTQWKKERSFKYSVCYKNLFGMKVVTLDYYVRLLYGGSVGGKGQYIASARVVPDNIHVLWGYNVDMSVNVPYIVNMRSAEDPLAAIALDVNWTVKNTLLADNNAEGYVLQGDGAMKNAKTGEVIFQPAAR